MLWLLLLARAPISGQQILDSLARSAGSGVEASVRAAFADPKEADYLLTMARRRGGLCTLKVFVIPSPPGYEKLGPFWAVFSARQDIEEDHDAVYPVYVGPDSWKLGPEIPEDGNRELRIARADVKARLTPARSRVDVTSEISLEGKASKAPIFRLNQPYQMGAWVGGKVWNVSDQVPAPAEGDLVKAGGLVIPWTKSVPAKLRFSYSGTLISENEDTITPDYAYVTAWWVPTLTRLPHPTSVEIAGPLDWQLRSEGLLISKTDAEDQQVKYRCDLPISFPKIVGGKYVRAAEGTLNGKTFTSWQFAPIDKARADRDVQLMKDAYEFYEKTLGPWPFPGYECFDAKGYYGIESYSYTLLAPRISSVYVTHEMGHTYFGGIVPSAYVHDSWNEGFTQYIDSVVWRKDFDRTLPGALRGMTESTPLSQMPVPHAFGGQSYNRGAYVLTMLEAEIGQDKVLAALKDIVRDRAGKETRWGDLRSYFEKTGKTDLGWFWTQWVDSATFPTVGVRGIERLNVDAPFRTVVKLYQMGSPRPMRLRFKVKLTDGTQVSEHEVSIRNREEEVTLSTPFRPSGAEIDVTNLSLARVAK